MNLRQLLPVAVGAAALLAPATATADEAKWLVAQPAPPAPPEGVPAASFTVPYGNIGDIAFWAPNRGLMTLESTSPLVRTGIYRYDGEKWSLYSTVCGGVAGSSRIIWAGPTEFWTIADVREGSAATIPAPPAGSTLCHFKDGAVVGSYAVPRGSTGAYETMFAGACNTPNDCWFGGSALAAPQFGAFHLHWDGSTIKRVIMPQGRPVSSMVSHAGSVHEAVKISDSAGHPRLSPFVPEYPSPGATNISRVNRFVPGGSDTTALISTPFVPNPRVTLVSGTVNRNFPVDGNELLAVDSADGQLWAAGGHATSGPSTGESPRGPLVALAQGDGPLTEWAMPRNVATSLNPSTGKPELRPLGANPIADIAAEPGTNSAWVAMRGTSRIAKITADPAAAVAARVTSMLTLPFKPTDPSPLSGTANGAISTIDCAAQNDCWAGTSAGWLYHYTDGTAHPIDTDPAFNRLITERPDDGATPTTFSDEPPVDDSLTDLQFFDAILPPPADPPAAVEDTTPAPRARNVKVQAVGRRGFRISFSLTARAKVKLKATRGPRTVAETKRTVLRQGRHAFTFRVSPKRWPTKINLDVREP